MAPQGPVRWITLSSTPPGGLGPGHRTAGGTTAGFLFAAGPHESSASAHTTARRREPSRRPAPQDPGGGDARNGPSEPNTHPNLEQ